MASEVVFWGDIEAMLEAAPLDREYAQWCLLHVRGEPE